MSNKQSQSILDLPSPHNRSSTLLINKPPPASKLGCKRCKDYKRILEEKNGIIKSLKEELQNANKKNEQLIRELEFIRNKNVSFIKKGFRMASETLSYLNETQDKNPFSKALKTCKENKNIDLNILKATEIDHMLKDYSSLVTECFDKLCETRDPQIRTKWQTTISDSCP